MGTTQAWSAAGPPQGTKPPSGGSAPHEVGERGGTGSFIDFRDVWLAYNDELFAAGQFAVEHLPLRIAGVAALALELSAPLALVNGRLRAVMIAAFGGFIISIWFLIAEPMFEFLVLLLFGVDWDALWRRARERAARYSPVSLRSMR